MAIECPMCGSKSTYKQRKMFGEKIFGCSSCGWKISQKKFHEKGGTAGIRNDN